MLGISKLYKMLMGNILNNPLSIVPTIQNSISNPTLTFPCKTNTPQPQPQPNDPMAKALTAVFGMNKDGIIPKEKACKVVKQLGLMNEDNEGEFSGFDMLEEELEAKEVLNDLEEEDRKKKEEVLREVFMVFDKDGDGYIDANEIKKVFVCLGLDNGWGISEIENMIKVVDVNLDGKVDFHEFEIMMG